MKAQLVKRQDRFDLYNESDGSKIASTLPNPMGKLSLKNCEVVVNGYDLIKLVEEKSKYSEEDWGDGFLFAMNLMSDKKFSEEDMKKAMNKIVTATYSNKGDDIFDLFIEIHRKKYMDEYIQSLQQTEWDVFFNPDEKDSEGCIILKSK